MIPTLPDTQKTGTGAASGWMPVIRLVVAVTVATLLTGCGDAEVNSALDSDANGYVCLGCKAQFYTDRTVFPTRCPDCKKQNFEQAIGYVCAADKHTTIGPRGRGGMACKQCGAITTGLSIPREAELKAWGATHRAEPEVTGN